MAGGGANGTERLGDFAGQLDALEALRQQLALTEATLAELQAALSGLGQNMGLLGGAGPFSPGPAGPPGKGSGGPGQGSGPVETAEGGPAGTTPTRAPSATSKDAPIIATWESQEEQEKGEARRAVRDTVQAAKDRAAEAIGENRIPARYHEAVKQYFGHLEGRPPGGER